ncbi:hypothetical protein VNO78_27897 [Psophocarpus tetragonolobus]|uniref:Uncharacterized protein n=1 Tax=Psophocarpus tetragonolobus TaxID=3891 RepID=A0AAN9XCR2_PSOTE
MVSSFNGENGSLEELQEMGLEEHNHKKGTKQSAEIICHDKDNTDMEKLKAKLVLTLLNQGLSSCGVGIPTPSMKACSPDAKQYSSQSASSLELSSQQLRKPASLEALMGSG